MLETIMGGLLGGLFRLAPEVLKWLDRKDERAHELNMTDKQIEFERIRGEMRMDEIGAQTDLAIGQGELKALTSALDQQAVMAKASSPWVAAFSALVRPMVTYFFFGIYAAYKIALIYAAYHLEGVGAVNALGMNWTDADWSALSMILSYWFIDRTVGRKL